MQVNHHCLVRSVAVRTEVGSSLTTVKTNEITTAATHNRIAIIAERCCDAVSQINQSINQQSHGRGQTS